MKLLPNAKPVSLGPPTSIREAGQLLLGAFGLDMFGILFAGEEIGTDFESVAVVVTAIAVSGIVLLFLLWKLQRRKPWARWLLSVYVVVTVLYTARTVLDDWNSAPALALFSIAASGLEIYALTLLFASRSTAWLYHRDA
jgi:hypothetical protein